MKSPGRYKSISIAALISVLVLTAIVSWLMAMPGISHCPEEGPSNSETYKVHPIKIVMQPWFGRHQVFGIFIVPLRYRSGMSYFGTMSIKTYNSEFAPDRQVRARQVDDVPVEPGFYLVRGYIHTRIALWFFLTGQFRDLQNPCNWTLQFVRRTASVNDDQ